MINNKLWKVVAITLCMILLIIPVSAQNLQPITKEETVYGLLNVDGKPHDIIVSEYIHCTSPLSKFNDYSTLNNIHNLKSDIEPENNEGNLTWDVNGYELYYQGNSSEQLPVTTNITYYLNDKEVKADEILGKSGNLKIVIHQDNKIYKSMNIEGEDRTIYSPFYSVATVTLTTDNYENVQVNQGKIVNDGNNFIVLGVLMPGMKDNLKEVENINIYDDLVITAKVDNFKMDPIYIAISNKLPNIDGVQIIDQLDELNDSMAQFEDAGNGLVEGANDLYNGEITYFEKLDTASKGLSDYFTNINSLSKGLSSMKQPVSDLYKGTADLVTGLSMWQQKISPLSEGLIKYSEGSNQFSTGADNFCKSINVLSDNLSQLPEGINQLSAAGDEINKSADSLDSGLKGLSQGTSDLYIAMKQFQEALDTNSELYAQYALLLGQMEGISNSSKTISNNMDIFTDKTSDFKAGMNSLKVKTAALADVTKDLTDGVAKLEAASKSLTESSQVLSNGISQSVEGITDLVSGGKRIEAGMKQLNDGMVNINDKMPALNTATSQLSEGMLKLGEASGQILSGTGDLKDGIIKFNKDGIEKLTEKVTVKENELKCYIAVKDAMEDMSKEYNNFAGTKKEFESSVSFLLKTDEIN